jgi:hypothetical protein
MRLALLVAPSDPRADDSASRREALAWLRGQLARSKFDVVIVGAAQNPDDAVAKAARSITAGDSVLVHVSGRLLGADGLAFGGGRSASLRLLPEAFAARRPADLSFVVDLTYEVDPNAAPSGRDRLVSVVEALGTASHGYAVLGALRRAADSPGRFAFTRAALGAALPPLGPQAAPVPIAWVLQAMHATAHGSPEGRAAAEHVLFRHGADSSEAAAGVSAVGPGQSTVTVAEGAVSVPEAVHVTDEFAVAKAPAASAVGEVAVPPAEIVSAAGESRAAVGSLAAADDTGTGTTVRTAGIDVHTLDDIETAAARAPTHAPLYATAFEIYRRDGNVDGALLAAMALEELGAMSPDHGTLVDHARSVGPVRARAPIDAAAWGRLRAPGYDEVLAALFAGIEDAAIRVKIESLRDARKLPSTDREQRLSETSTASVVRTFQWAARFLGVRCPDLYAVDHVSGIEVIQAREPSTALGRTVLSGRSAKDLAFLAARHLTYLRPEHRVLLHYPTRDELTELLFATVQLGLRESASAAASPEIRALRARLATRIDEPARRALVQAVQALDARGGQARIGAWMRGVELTAARAGLLVCGDLATAAGFVRAETRAVTDLSTSERRGDLLAFCASRAHLELRAQFVAAAPESGTPPPLSGIPSRTLAAS